MLTIIIIFALSAVVGLSLILKVLKGEKPSRISAIMHGGLAAAGLVLLFLEFNGGAQELLLPFGIFVAAALGGFFLFAQDVSGKPIPKPVSLVHAGAAVTAFLILLYTYFT